MGVFSTHAPPENNSFSRGGRIAIQFLAFKLSSHREWERLIQTFKQAMTVEEGGGLSLQHQFAELPDDIQEHTLFNTWISTSINVFRMPHQNKI